MASVTFLVAENEVIQIPANKTYNVKIMAAKQGKKPARMGYYEVEASSEQRALEIANAAAQKHHKTLCEVLGRDPETRIWAELA